MHNAFTSLYGSTSDRALTDTASFRVLPSIGQIVEGHVLIVPKVHYCSLADMPKDRIQELDRVHNEVISAIRSTYGTCVSFEHGVRKVGSGGCGIDHAHMHVIPVVVDRVLAVLRSTFPEIALKSFQEIGTLVPSNSSYLFFESSLQEKYVFPVEYIPSQYMRRLIAEEIGEDNWDWRKARYESRLISTVQRLSPALSTIDCSRG